MTWHVPSRQSPTIQDGIDAASDGDEVVVKPGTYTGDGNRDIDFGGRAITVRGTDPNDPDRVAATIIDCNGTEAEPHRGFYFHNGEGANSILSGFTIKKGYTSNACGGGIFCNLGSSPTIINNIITENVADMGGGISCWNSSCPMVRNNKILGNTAVYNAGGIECYSASPEIKNNIIAGNSASDYGGSIACWSSASPKVINNTITGNTANKGGGISTWSSDPVISNCILWSNRASEGSQVYSNNSIVMNYSDIQGGWPSLGNIDVDPYFVDPGYWDANGTPDDANDDFWVDGDYHLQSAAGRWNQNSESWVTDANTSVCIDAGNPGCPPGSEPLPNGSRINMGAYGGTPTASKSPADWRSIADLTNDWAVDFNDLGVFVDYWLDTGQCIPSDLNHNGSVDFNDFAIFSQQWPDTPAVGPGVTYQIDDCDLETEQGLAVVSQSGELRFSVTVEGSFIHFEDMMVANCCPNELGLEMTVADSLITIYETEYTPGGCWCICDYPVTATLGPFEPGVYILEVYEDWTGFIGRTIVIIE